MNIIYKTLIDAFGKCNMYGYLKYFHEGKGVELDRKTFELSVGSAVHVGCDALWQGKDIEDAVCLAHEEYAHDLAESDMFGDVEATAAKEIQSYQLDVIEAILRIWAKRRLPILLKEFEFVQSETKTVVRMTDDLGMLAKPDAILKSRFDGRYVNWSLKTAKKYSLDKHPSALIDTGGLTEAIIAANAVGGNDLKKISGTAMEYLVVGEVADKENVIFHPGVIGWRKLNENNGQYEYAWRWTFENPDYDPFGPKSTYHNPKSRSLSAKEGWQRFRARDYPGGIKAWVEDLMEGKFTPTHQDPGVELVIAPTAYHRTEMAVTRFWKTMLYKFSRIFAMRQALNEGMVSIEEAFPMENTSCLRYGKEYRCEMWQICHEGTDPLGSGKYKRRLSSAEREAMRK